MNKGGKNVAVSHIDKTLDDYIKKARGNEKKSKGRPNIIKGKQANDSSNGRGRGAKGGISRMSRRIGKTIERPQQRLNLRKTGGPANRGGQVNRGVRRTAGLRRQPPMMRASRPLIGRTRAPQRAMLRRTAVRKTGPVNKQQNMLPRKNVGIRDRLTTKSDKLKASQKAKKITTRKTKLFVSSLPMNVTNSDLYTLFGQFGPLKKCRIDYDNLGRSYGTAVLEYKREMNAKTAQEEYNGAELDGKPIKIELMVGTAGDDDESGPSQNANKSQSQNSQNQNSANSSKQRLGIKKRGMMKRRFSGGNDNNGGRINDRFSRNNRDVGRFDGNRPQSAGRFNNMNNRDRSNSFNRFDRNSRFRGGRGGSFMRGSRMNR